MAKNMKWNQILDAATIRYQQIITAYNKGDCVEMEGLCLASLFSSENELYEDTFDEIRFSDDDELIFTVDGHMFWCDVCVGYGLSSRDRVINTAERWKNGEHFGEISDKYIIWCEDKLPEGVEAFNPPHIFVGWEWGTDDLEPGAVVPKHIIDACKKWLEKGN